MGRSILVTGGARSGKSAYAEARALACAAGAREGGARAVYIATAEAHDAEMAERIRAHQARRGAEWRTVAAPLDLARALRESDGGPPRLVDCLTLWLSNLLLAGQDSAAAGRALAAALAAQSAPVVLVTNEVGAGIVPENALARRFRDEAGRLNQEIAALCDEVVLVVAGQPLKVKPGPHASD